jgi:hypothetical protein
MSVATVSLQGYKELKAYLAFLPKEAQAELRKETKSSLQAIQTRYRRLGRKHFKTGQFDKSIFLKSSDAFLSGSVGSDVKQAVFLEFGTRAHLITPRNASKLRFFWPKFGKIVYFKKVNHPGTKPKNLLLQAWISVMEPNTYIERVRARFKQL